MCGFAGLWTSASSEGIERIAERMGAMLDHRGPDGAGIWTDIQSGVALSHRRLAVVDVTQAGHQPMSSPSGRFVVAYNGEVYNHRELRAALEAQGCAPGWRGSSDTETLLAVIESWGLEEALRRCSGMFAFALWDRQERRLVLARDRAGEKPLYYGWQRESFLFGSELKSLRAHPSFRADVDRGAIALLLRYNYIPTPHTIYSGVYKLPPGTYLEIRQGQREARPVVYWSALDIAERGVADPFTGDEVEALDVLSGLLNSAVSAQCVADVPLGSLLSGGIDSSLITALMQAQSSRPVRTFTIGFEEAGYDEAVHARAIARHLGTEHTELRLTPADALAVVPTLPDMYDEPFADSSQIPTHLVMRLARRHVTVALSGDAGDEFFGGYNRYLFLPKVWSSLGWLPRPLRNGGLAIAGLAPGAIGRVLGASHVRNKLGKVRRVFRGPASSIEDLYVTLVGEWEDAAGLVVGGNMPPNLLDQRSRWPTVGGAVPRIMALDAMTYLPDDILVKVDRASMAVSLETRAPFLDRDVMEFAWRLPMHMKIRDGKGKRPLRQLLERYVPNALIDRPKHGFGIPLDEWLRGPLREWAGDLLSESRLAAQGYLNPLRIQRTWRDHLANRDDYGYRLWSVLMFQAWLERHGREASA